MKLYPVSRIHDPRGTLTAVQDIPFEIKRVYYLYDIPGGESQRGGHAHLKCERLLFALSGSFQAFGSPLHGPSETYTLNRPWVGLYVPRYTWLELREFSGGAICLVLASEKYDEADYVRDPAIWRQMRESAVVMEKP